MGVRSSLSSLSSPYPSKTAFGVLSLVSDSFLNYIVTWPMFSSTVMYVQVMLKILLS